MQLKEWLIEPLWPEGAPGALNKDAIDIPAVTFYPAERGTGAAVIVCPGGGYAKHAPHESTPVAQWLNAMGVNAFVLRYRLAPHYKHPSMMLDVKRAVRLVRFHARNQGIDPDRIGVLGFSAGGHLAATACVHWDEGDPAAADPIDRVSSRPDVGILLYPVITMGDPMAHAGSRRNLLGDDPSADLVELMSLEKQVTPRTPPTFLFHTVDDQGVPVENSLLFASALRSAGVPFELHCYEHGRHGVGLADTDPVLHTWPTLCGYWLQTRKFGRGPQDPGDAKKKIPTRKL